MDQVYLDNTVRQWLAAAGILAGSTLALFLIERFLLGRFARFARHTRTPLDDFLAYALRRTKLALLSLVAIFLASLPLTVDPRWELVLRRVAAIAIVVQGGVWAVAAITFWVDRFVEKAGGEDAAAVTTVSALSFVGRLAVWLVVLLLILDNLGVEVTALLTGLGIGGIAVALAVQNILGDLFASLSIVLDRPFVIGDFLVVGDYKGEVEHVGLKTTRLRSLTGEQLILGNSDLLSSRIRNLGRMGDRRGELKVGVTYDTPREKLRAIPGWIEQIVGSLDHARHDRTHLASFGAYSIDFETVYFVTVPEYAAYMDIRQGINLALHEKFEKEGVAFAYPTQVVYTIPGQADA